MFKKIICSIVLMTTVISLIGCDSSVTEADIYEITFDSKQGTRVDPIEVKDGTSIDLPTPNREGHEFLGWSKFDTEEADIIEESFTPETDVLLYAVWKVNQYTISFDTNGGTMIESITKDYGMSVAQPDDPVKEGYLFAGWYLDSRLTTSYTFSTMPAEDVILYAAWDEVDWSIVESYLDDMLVERIEADIDLPTSYQEYSISWESSDPSVVSNTGEYNRPYQPITVTLSAIIQTGQHTVTKTYDIDVEAYKSLEAPLTSSYIYRNYNTVDDNYFEALDIINCAFIRADEQGNLTGTSVLNNINIYIMPKAQEHGNWVVFSIAPSSDYSSIAASTNRVQNLADNIVDMINQYGFDGVDIDWETPTPSEATRFTDMMEVIYTKVKENNPNHLVTAAIAGGMWQPPNYDLENSYQYLDYINMMTYGMVSNNGYYQNALNQSTTYDNQSSLAGKTLTSCSIEESVAIYNSYGIPNSKIIVGVAFYGIQQTRTYDEESATWSTWSKEGSLSYTYISNYYLSNNNYDYYYDSAAGVPYILSTDKTVFISYDNPRSIAQKSEYIIEQELAGMMYWEHGHDSTGALLMAMESGLKD